MKKILFYAAVTTVYMVGIYHVSSILGEKLGSAIGDYLEEKGIV